MWILECDGDIFEGKRIWLRPGKSYLFGRTRPEGGRYAGFEITDKSVSRKHLTVSVSTVNPGQSTDPNARSELHLEDMGTKTGTYINDTKFHAKKQILTSGDEHTFKLGGYKHLFRVKWMPVVLAFSFSSKETKDGKDPLIPIRSRLEDFDIKILIPYMVGVTTHVVSAKRNTSKCLQALINAKYVVDNRYLDAVVYAATPSDLDVPESLSPLEEDFDRHWPDPAGYLPPPGKEPGQSSEDLFKPDQSRANVFEGITFIFFGQRQFETLQPPITNGSGKALNFPLEWNITTSEEIVEFVRSITKDHDSEESKVILIQIAAEKEHVQWAETLQLEVQTTLGRSFVRQNEFLNVILTNDPSTFQRSVHGLSEAMPATTRSQARSTEQNTPELSQPSENPPPSRGRRARVAVKSAFSGFDDGFDPSDITIKRSASNSSTGRRAATQPVQVADNHPDTVMREPEPEQETPQAHRKRGIDELFGADNLPATAALKKRRLEQEKHGEPNPKSTSPMFKSQPKKTKKEPIDLTEAMATRRKEADASDDEQKKPPIHEVLAGMTVQDMQSLAQVEVLPDPPTRSARSHTNGTHNERWDPDWNGRKNFKGFRRRGENGQQRRRGQTVIVPLELVPPRRGGVGVGGPSFDINLGARAAQHVSEARAAQRGFTSRHRERALREEADEDRSRSQSFASARSTQPHRHEEEVPAELQDGAEHEVIDVDAPRQTRLAGADARGAAEQRMNKRSAPPGGASGGTGKKLRLARRGDSEEDDDDDGTRFRFRRKR